MYISKELNKKVERDYFFIKGQIDIDCDYFIEKIKQGVEEKQNMSYKTNVKGKMTSWNFFNNNLNFIKQLRKFITHIDKNYTLPAYTLIDSWGFINFSGEKTDYHTHSYSLFSGVIYLSDCQQPLIFKEIEQEVIPKQGAFCLFSSWLSHGCEINNTNNSKFGISFNMNEKPNW